MLIFPRLVEFRVIDTVATAASGGYDVDDEGRRRPTRTNANDGSPVTTGLEETTVRMLAQFESGTQRQVSWTPTGDTPRSQAGLTIDAEDLEARGLIHPKTRMPMLKTGDRFLASFDAETEELLFREDDPGIRVVEVRALDKLPGISQLYLVMLEDRPLGGGG